MIGTIGPTKAAQANVATHRLATLEIEWVHAAPHHRTIPILQNTLAGVGALAGFLLWYQEVQLDPFSEFQPTAHRPTRQPVDPLHRRNYRGNELVQITNDLIAQFDRGVTIGPKLTICSGGLLLFDGQIKGRRIRTYFQPWIRRSRIAAIIRTRF